MYTCCLLVLHRLLAVETLLTKLRGQPYHLLDVFWPALLCLSQYGRFYNKVKYTWVLCGFPGMCLMFALSYQAS